MHNSENHGVCGGHARVRNTRIPVWTIISLQQQGSDTPELLRNFPSLTLDDFSNVQAYYFSHREEIDRAIASHQYAGLFRSNQWRSKSSKVIE